MTLTILAAFAFAFALIPAYFFTLNQFLFRRLEATAGNSGDKIEPLPQVSVLIPARNEETSIGACIESVLANIEVDLEVIVLDDQSEDETATIVEELSDSNSRVQLARSEPLPVGWCGKQFACHQLAQLASHDIFVFLDADVRLSPNALTRMSKRLQTDSVDLLSGFPQQITETLFEQMLIPLIHFVLLGFLSLRRMRLSRRPAFSAECGQLFMTYRDAYQRSGGHATIRRSLHDGLKLPRAYRMQGLKTDIFDATNLATCRMYRNAHEVWHGLRKNATEGVASVRLIVPVTLMLLAGQILPFVLVSYALLSNRLSEPWAWISGIALAFAWIPRLFAAARYQQSYLGALLHPVSIAVFLVIQWSALLGSFSRKKVAWKGRPYPT